MITKGENFLEKRKGSGNVENRVSLPEKKGEKLHRLGGGGRKRGGHTFFYFAMYVSKKSVFVRKKKKNRVSLAGEKVKDPNGGNPLSEIL